MQEGDQVPRGVAKWTKRNHTAAVKVRLRLADAVFILTKSRHWLGVHGSKICWLQEVEQTINISISGHPTPELVPRHSPPLPKSPRSSGLPMPKNYYQPTVSPITTSVFGLTLLLRKFTIYQHTTRGFSLLRSARMDVPSLRLLVMRISNFGRFGKSNRPKRSRRMKGTLGAR